MKSLNRICFFSFFFTHNFYNIWQYTNQKLLISSELTHNNLLHKRLQKWWEKKAEDYVQICLSWSTRNHTNNHGERKSIPECTSNLEVDKLLPVSQALESESIAGTDSPKLADWKIGKRPSHQWPSFEVPLAMSLSPFFRTHLICITLSDLHIISLSQLTSHQTDFNMFPSKNWNILYLHLCACTYFPIFKHS